MSDFTSIAIIYNPNSTGPSHKLARELKQQIRDVAPHTKVQLIATRHAGHAEELAYELAQSTSRPLIISSSGDGGYNEVINGLLKAQSEGAHPVAGLLPAGNANDHYHNVHRGNDLATRIIRGRNQILDVLELNATVNGRPYKRYAHSYIGFGLTPEIGAELNKVDLNWLREIGIVAKGLLRLRPVKIRRNGSVKSFDSIILSNVGTMSKYMKLAKRASVHDGKFEITAFRKHSKSKLIRNLVHASTVGFENARQLRRYTFQTVRPLAVQLDGEIHKIDRNSKVTVTISQQSLRCIV